MSSLASNDSSFQSAAFSVLLYTLNVNLSYMLISYSNEVFVGDMLVNRFKLHSKSLNLKYFSLLCKLSTKLLIACFWCRDSNLIHRFCSFSRSCVVFMANYCLFFSENIFRSMNTKLIGIYLRIRFPNTLSMALSCTSSQYEPNLDIFAVQPIERCYTCFHVLSLRHVPRLGPFEAKDVR